MAFADKDYVLNTLSSVSKIYADYEYEMTRSGDTVSVRTRIIIKYKGTTSAWYNNRISGTQYINGGTAVVAETVIKPNTSGGLGGNKTWYGSWSPWKTVNTYGTIPLRYHIKDPQNTGNIDSDRTFNIQSPEAQESTITTFDNFEIGADVPWAVDKRNPAYAHKVELLVSNQVITSVNTASASGTFSISTAMKNTMLGLTPATVSISAVLRVTTYTSTSYTTAIGQVRTKASTATVGLDIIPNFSGISHSENVSSVQSLVGAYVKTKSRLNLAINGAVAGQGSTIKSHSISVAGQVINAASGTTGIINQSGLLKITATVTDNRNRPVSKFIEITALDYNPPKIESVSFVRSKSNGDSDPLGEFVKVEFKGSVGSLLNDGVEKNSLNYKIKSKKSSEGLYTTKTDVNHSTLNYNGSTVLGVYEVDYSFNFVVEVSDIFETSISAGLIPIGVVLQHWASDSTAVGMLLPGQDYNVYVGSKGIKSYGPIIDKNGNEIAGGGLFPVGAIYTSVTPTNPSTFFGGTWVPFATGRALVGIDTSQTEFNTVKKTGGHKSLQSHTHTYSGTTGGGGAHNHQSRGFYANRSGDALGGQRNMANSTIAADPLDTNSLVSAPNHTHPFSGTTASTGGGNAQNLQPYITVYMWERTG